MHMHSKSGNAGRTVQAGGLEAVGDARVLAEVLALVAALRQLLLPPRALQVSNAGIRPARAADAETSPHD